MNRLSAEKGLVQVAVVDFLSMLRRRDLVG